MSWIAVGVAGASLVSGVVGGNRAANQRERAAGNAINEQNVAYGQADEFLQPRAEQEQSAMEQVNRLLGLSGESPDYSAFRASPGYQFQLDQGQQAIERSAAARGGLQSGNTLAAVTQFGQGLADTTFRNYLSDVMQLQNQGVDAARANLTTERASNIGNLLLGQGEARASGVETGVNAFNQFGENFVGIWGQSGRMGK